MSGRDIVARPLARDAFAPFGDVIETACARQVPINAGLCIRYHDLAHVECLGEAARPLISIFRSKPRLLPYRFDLVERHPLGSQAFYPLSGQPWLVIATPDEAGRPGRPEAFLAGPDQGVNFRAGTWHGVLTPLDEEASFLVVDRGGEGGNLEEFVYPEPWRVVA